MSGIVATFADRAFRGSIAEAGPCVEKDADAWARMCSAVGSVWRGDLDAWTAPGVSLGRAERRSAARARRSEKADGIIQHEGCVIALDGFLFGGAELRADAVGIIDAYLRRGEACLDGLDGELAFVLWDARNRTFFAGCDATGGRTLAYVVRQEGIAIATRGLALLAGARSKARIDDDYVAHVVCDAWSLGPGATAFEGMRRLRPGHALIGSPRGVDEKRIAVVRPRASNARSPLEWRACLVDAIDAAVDARSTRGGTGIALSGGLDSASIAASLARRGTAIEAFTIVSPARPDLDESAQLRALATHLPAIRLHAIACDGDDAFDDDPSRPTFDDPILVGGGFLAPRTRLLDGACAAGIEHILDGDGGDELFDLSTVLSDLLEPSHWSHLREASPSWAHVRSAVWRRAIVPRLPSPLRDAWHDRDVRLRRTTPTWLRKDYANGARARATLREPWEQGALGTYDRRVLFLLNRAWTAGSRVAMRILAASRGISASSPLIDARVIGVAIAAPPELRFAEGRSKAFLRDAMRLRLPPEVWAREKDDRLHFDYVKRSLLSRRTSERLLDRLRSATPLADAIDPHEVERVLARLRAGAPGDTTILWRLAALVRFVDWLAAIERDFAS